MFGFRVDNSRNHEEKIETIEIETMKTETTSAELRQRIEIKIRLEKLEKLESMVSAELTEELRQRIETENKIILEKLVIP